MAVFVTLTTGLVIGVIGRTIARDPFTKRQVDLLRARI